MTFEHIAKWYEKKFETKITKEAVINKIPSVIDKVNSASDVATNLRNITIEALNGIEYTFNYGTRPHKLTKDKLTKAIDAFEKIGELESNTEEEKNDIELFANVTEKLLDEWYKPAEKYKR